MFPTLLCRITTPVSFLSSIPPPPAPECECRVREEGRRRFSKKQLSEGDLSPDKEKLANALSEEGNGRGEETTTTMTTTTWLQEAAAGQGYEISEEDVGMFIWFLVHPLLRAISRLDKHTMTEGPVANYVDMEA